MADVVASVTAVLSQTGLQTALQVAVPAVLQRHLQQMAAEARQQLLPSGEEAGAAPPTTQVGCKV
jgi:membrane-bound lytic murein transglycosylase B